MVKGFILDYHFSSSIVPGQKHKWFVFISIRWDLVWEGRNNWARSGVSLRHELTLG